MADQFSIVANVRSRMAGDTWATKISLEPDPPHKIIEISSMVQPYVPPAGLAATDAEIVQDIAEYLDLLSSKDVFSGVVALAHGGLTFFQRACGLASRSFEYPNNMETRFNLASMGKMFTGTAIAQLAEKGRLAFDDPLITLLPDYPDADIARKVTVHQLLTHSAGLGDIFGPGFDPVKHKLRTVQDFFPLFTGKPLLFEPGTSWSYSNASYIVLGAVIEKLTGQDYWQYIRENVWGPAGMIATDAYELDRDVPNLAVGYTHMGPAGFDLDSVWNNTLTLMAKGCPAGGSYSTAGDILRFARAIRDHRLLSPASIDLVLTGKVDTIGHGESRYGYGFEEARVGAVRVAGHGGGAPGAGTNLDLFRDRPYDAVVLGNCDAAARLIVNRVRGWVAATAG